TAGRLGSCVPETFRIERRLRVTRGASVDRRSSVSACFATPDQLGMRRRWPSDGGSIPPASILTSDFPYFSPHWDETRSRNVPARAYRPRSLRPDGALESLAAFARHIL